MPLTTTSCQSPSDIEWDTDKVRKPPRGPLADNVTGSYQCPALLDETLAKIDIGSKARESYSTLDLYASDLLALRPKPDTVSDKEWEQRVRRIERESRRNWRRFARRYGVRYLGLSPFPSTLESAKQDLTGDVISAIYASATLNAVRRVVASDTTIGRPKRAIRAAVCLALFDPVTYSSELPVGLHSNLGSRLLLKSAVRPGGFTLRDISLLSGASALQTAVARRASTRCTVDFLMAIGLLRRVGGSNGRAQPRYATVYRRGAADANEHELLTRSEAKRMVSGAAEVLRSGGGQVAKLSRDPAQRWFMLSDGPPPDWIRRLSSDTLELQEWLLHIGVLAALGKRPETETTHEASGLGAERDLPLDNVEHFLGYLASDSSSRGIIQSLMFHLKDARDAARLDRAPGGRQRSAVAARAYQAWVESCRKKGATLTLLVDLCDVTQGHAVPDAA